MKEFKEIETTKENGLDPYRYLLWGLQSAPKLSEMDTTWEEHLTPSTHWINAGCQKIKESWLVPALLYCALSGSTVTIKVHWRFLISQIFCFRQVLMSSSALVISRKSNVSTKY